MKISNFKRNKDGSCDFEYHVSEEEASLIMEHGIIDLVDKGFIQVDAEEAQMELFDYEKKGGVVS